MSIFPTRDQCLSLENICHSFLMLHCRRMPSECKYLILNLSSPPPRDWTVSFVPLSLTSTAAMTAPSRANTLHTALPIPLPAPKTNIWHLGGIYTGMKSIFCNTTVQFIIYKWAKIRISVMLDKEGPWTWHFHHLTKLKSCNSKLSY